MTVGSKNPHRPAQEMSALHGAAEAEPLPERQHRLLRTVGQYSAMPLMLLLTTVPIAVLALEDSRLGQLRWIEYFVIATFSFFPGWLFMRFITLRGPAIWQEYVIQLHRLGADRREYLPCPPVESEYYLPWQQAREGLGDYQEDQNVYKEKFNAYYGRNFLEAVESENRRPRTETLFPVLLCTAVFSVAWSGILSSGMVHVTDPRSLADVLAFGFAGAYLFVLQMLIRRFFQSDLKSSAYASAFVRVVAVLLIVSVVYQLPVFGAPNQGAVAAITAFVVGFFPTMGLRALQRTAQLALTGAVPSMRTAYPLSELDGVNLWYETRLLEEGIEDQEELITANIVDVMLHTRVPVSRLIDWLDQAHLYLHLPPPERRSRSRPDVETVPHEMRREVWIRKLRTAGIRNASELLVAFGVYHPLDRDIDSSHSEAHVSGKDVLLRAGSVVGERGAKSLVMVIRVMQNDTALTPVLNWRHWGAKRLYELQSGTTRDEPTGGRNHDR